MPWPRKDAQWKGKKREIRLCRSQIGNRNAKSESINGFALVPEQIDGGFFAVVLISRCSEGATLPFSGVLWSKCVCVCVCVHAAV